MQAAQQAAAAMEMALALAEFSQRYRALKAVPVWKQQAENRLANELKKLFTDAADRTVAELLRSAGMPVDDATRKKILRHLTESIEHFGEAIYEQGLRAAESGRQMTLQDAAREFGDLQFSEFSKHTRDLIKEHAFTASQRTISRMTGDVMGQLSDMYERGLGIDAGAQELRAVFDTMRDYELQRVARTEVQSFQNEGAHLTMEELGVEFEIWESVGDERTRGNKPNDLANHVWLDGCITRVGDPFPNGLMYPGDRSDGEDTIQEWINCRCRSRPYLMPEGKMAPPGKSYFFEHELISIQGPGAEDAPILTEEDRQQAMVPYAATLGQGGDNPRGVPLIEIVSDRADQNHQMWAREYGMTVEEYRAAVDAKLAEINGRADIMSRVPNEEVLQKILDDGRLKSQFEVGTSRGMFNPEYRAESEVALFGSELALPDNQRPIYGFLCDGTNKDDAVQYGNIVIRMDKGALEGRTTFTYDDSLGMRQVPQLLTDPGWEAVGREADVLRYSDLSGAARPYPECQIHGGVGKESFAEVIFSSEPSEAMVESLTREGIPYSVDKAYDPYNLSRYGD